MIQGNDKLSRYLRMRDDSAYLENYRFNDAN